MTYLLEAKWHKDPTSHAELAAFKMKVDGKAAHEEVFLSVMWAILLRPLEAFWGKSTDIVGMNGLDLCYIVEGRIGLVKAMQEKARRAAGPTACAIAGAYLTCRHDIYL